MGLDHNWGVFILQRWTSEECVDESNPGHWIHQCAMSLYGVTDSQEGVHCVCVLEYRRRGLLCKVHLQSWVSNYNHLFLLIHIVSIVHTANMHYIHWACYHAFCWLPLPCIPLDDLKRKGTEEIQHDTTCMSALQQWHVPPNCDVAPLPVKDISFPKPEYGKEFRAKIQGDEDSGVTDDVKELLETVGQHCPNGGLFHFWVPSATSTEKGMSKQLWTGRYRSWLFTSAVQPCLLNVMHFRMSILRVDTFRS